MDVHPFVARGFADVAEAYERGRPDYPPDAVVWLAQRAGIGPGTTVVDVGAGTGKLTRHLVALGARVIAVEPLAPMREVLARTVPDADLVAGSAEAIPRPDASADAVTAGQAAHWFRADEAAGEFARVLRRGGGVGLIWNGRDLDDPLQAAIEELIAPSRERAPVDRWPDWRDGLARGPFSPLEEAQFAHVHQLAVGEVAALVSSYSYVGALPALERDALLQRVQELVLSSDNVSPASEGPRVRLAYRTDAYACRRR
ncbi:MAG: methyltransferase domain-containing protein [Thermoleophilia bacterium]|nr:methyltransferase domain-containing protein [Thermoleophilia bacterium]